MLAPTCRTALQPVNAPYTGLREPFRIPTPYVYNDLASPCTTTSPLRMHPITQRSPAGPRHHDIRTQHQHRPSPVLPTTPHGCEKRRPSLDAPGREPSLSSPGTAHIVAPPHLTCPAIRCKTQKDLMPVRAGPMTPERRSHQRAALLCSPSTPSTQAQRALCGISEPHICNGFASSHKPCHSTLTHRTTTLQHHINIVVHA